MDPYEFTYPNSKESEQLVESAPQDSFDPPRNGIANEQASAGDRSNVLAFIAFGHFFERLDVNMVSALLNSAWLASSTIEIIHMALGGEESPSHSI